MYLNDTAPAKIGSLSLHDALPILSKWVPSLRSSSATRVASRVSRWVATERATAASSRDRKSTRLNSSHVKISYAVFCLKKKKKIKKTKNEKNGYTLLMPPPMH